MTLMDGTPVWTALHTVMSGWFIRLQTLTYTKSNAERAGPMAMIAATFDRLRTGTPLAWYSDNPPALHSLLKPFSNIWQRVTPALAPAGKSTLSLPDDIELRVASTVQEVDDCLQPWLDHLRTHRHQQLLFHIDAEWNLSRRRGVSLLSLLEDSAPKTIYLLRVSSESPRLSLLARLLIVCCSCLPLKLVRPPWQRCSDPTGW